MQKRNKLAPLILMALLALTCSMSVFAAPEEPKEGTIQIVLADGVSGTSKANVVFEYDKVAEVVNGEYILIEPYKQANVDLNVIEYSKDIDKAAQELGKYMDTNNKVATDQTGKAIISDLEEGVYLLRVSDQAGYENVNPALIAIPTWNEEDGTMDYKVTVYPKHSPKPEIPETGDRSFYLGYAVLCAASLTGIIVPLAFYWKTRKESELLERKEQ